MRMIEIYSTYRNLHARTASTNKVKPKQTSIPSLAMSPFKWHYLKNPWVYAPMVIAGGGSFLFSPSEKPLADAQEIVMFGNRYSPYRALFLLSATIAYKQVLTATGEEMYWRGIVQTELTERLHPSLALAISSLLFGAWHIPNKGLRIQYRSHCSRGLFWAQIQTQRLRFRRSYRNAFLVKCYNWGS